MGRLWLVILVAGALSSSTCGGPSSGETSVDSEAAEGGATGPGDLSEEEAPIPLDSVESEVGPDVPSADQDTSGDVASGAGEVVPSPPAETILKAVITSPQGDVVLEVGQNLELIGVVTDSYFESQDLQVIWSTDDGAMLLEDSPGPAGWSLASVSFESPGEKMVLFTVTNPNGQSVVAKVPVGVCTWGEAETFSQDLGELGWTIYGDAYWEPGGWLEMTGNAQGKKGAIFNTGAFVNPGDVTISFSIWTGEGINSGADGFAMSVVNVKTIDELEIFVDTAQAGGCLGYGVSGPCGTLSTDAFHIEFDTWHNTGDPNTDPTPGNHAAITLNGDPGDHLLWADMSEVEGSGQWHDVEIDIEGSSVTVIMDGATKLTGTIPDFLFHGGFIGFSGTTGWATNYHRFDNLHVKQGCQVPPAPVP